MSGTFARSRASMRRWPALLAAILVLALSMVSIGHPIDRTGVVEAARGTVDVYYAASLKALNEGAVGPAFQASGYTYRGFPEASGLIVNQIKAHLITPDVVEFADATLNGQLMGHANGDVLRWYVTFARTHLVIGFSPKSRMAAMFERARRGRVPWYKPLLQPGIRFGRTDPNADPKGYRVIMAFNLARKLYHLPSFTQRVLGPVFNPDPRGLNSQSAQVFPESTLVSQLSSGNLDAGVFYLPEARAAHIPYINLPEAISFGLSRYARLDASQTYTNSQGVTIKGTPVFYTLSIPGTVRNRAAAVAFAKFVLSKTSRNLEAGIGLQSVKHQIFGNKRAVPRGIR